MSAWWFAHSLTLEATLRRPKTGKAWPDARAILDGVAQKLKVSVTRRLRPGWVKRGRSTLWLCGGGK